MIKYKLLVAGALFMTLVNVNVVGAWAMPTTTRNQGANFSRPAFFKTDKLASDSGCPAMTSATTAQAYPMEPVGTETPTDQPSPDLTEQTKPTDQAKDPCTIAKEAYNAAGQTREDRSRDLDTATDKLTKATNKLITQITANDDEAATDKAQGEVDDAKIEQDEAQTAYDKAGKALREARKAMNDAYGPVQVTINGRPVNLEEDALESTYGDFFSTIGG